MASAPTDLPADPAALVALALEVAQEASVVVGQALGAAREPVATKSSPTDLVTATDQAVEALVVGRLLDARPGDGVLGEEGASVAGTSGVTWVVDPIDGTTNFAYGLGAHSTSIAAEVGGRAVAGVVVAHASGEAFTATLGGGARLEGRPVRTRPAGAPLAHALLSTGFSYDPGRRAAQAAALAHVLPRVRDLRRMGSAALDLCGVACGRLDAHYERGLARWDHAAGALIAAEAGAAVGTLEGGPPAADRTIVAVRADLEADLHALLRAAGADRVP